MKNKAATTHPRCLTERLLFSRAMKASKAMADTTTSTQANAATGDAQTCWVNMAKALSLMHAP